MVTYPADKNSSLEIFGKITNAVTFKVYQVRQCSNESDNCFLWIELKAMTEEEIDKLYSQNDAVLSPSVAKMELTDEQLLGKINISSF